MGIGKEAGEAVATFANKAPVVLIGIVSAFALAISLSVRFIPGERADAFTGKMGKEMETRIERQISTLNAQSRERHEDQDKELGALHASIMAHAALDAHSGAGRQLAAIASDLNHIRADLLRIESKMNDGSK